MTSLESCAYHWSNTHSRPSLYWYKCELGTNFLFQSSVIGFKVYHLAICSLFVSSALFPFILSFLTSFKQVFFILIFNFFLFYWIFSYSFFFFLTILVVSLGIKICLNLSQSTVKTVQQYNFIYFLLSFTYLICIFSVYYKPCHLLLFLLQTVNNSILKKLKKYFFFVTFINIFAVYAALHTFLKIWTSSGIIHLKPKEFYLVIWAYKVLKTLGLYDLILYCFQDKLIKDLSITPV